MTFRTDSMWPDYYRSKDGFTIHRADCLHALEGAPWFYLQGRDASFVALLIHRYDWLQTCSVCRPDVERSVDLTEESTMAEERDE